jgi:cell division protein FtsB
MKQTNKLDEDSKTYFPEYKEIASSSKQSDQEKVFRLEKENQELADLNKMLKKELDKLSKQVELIEKKKVIDHYLAMISDLYD